MTIGKRHRALIEGQPHYWPMVFASDYDAVLAREQALLNSIETSNAVRARLQNEVMALQHRLNVADQLVDYLNEQLNKSLLAIKRTYQAGRDRIVEMGGDCDGVEYMMNSDLTVKEIRTALSPLAQPATTDEFSTCLGCFGTGTVSTGIEEASSTICNGCNGTGRDRA